MKKIYIVLAAIFFCSINFAQTTSVTFSSSGPFVVPAGVTEVTIEVVGAGGDGGSNGGGGGGGGGYAVGVYAVIPGSTLNVSIGTNGFGAITGTTSVDALISASGGLNGSSGGMSLGGAPGVGTGGLINRTGGAGGNGTYTYFGGGGGGAAGSSSNGTVGGLTPAWSGSNCLQFGGTPGTGGGAPGGNGGKGSGFIDGACNLDNPATPGLNYGGGGGGANGNGGPASMGADGYCIVSYCSLDLSTTIVGTTITANAVSPTSYQWIDCGTNLPIPGETNASYSPSDDGDYAVIIEDGDCIDTSDCVSVICTVDVSTTLVGSTITANAVGMTSYGWLDCGAAAQLIGEYNISYTAIANGSYAVIINDAGCIDTSACVNITGLGLDPNSNLNIRVYPNPFTNQITIENEIGTEYFELINAQGQLIWSGKNIETTDFSTLEVGIYALKIYREETVQIVSLVKK